jgi:hypothetical protein
MSLNNQQIIEQTKTAASKLLKDKGYVSVVDVLMEIGKLSNQDYENWRRQKVPYLEKVIRVNLSKINTILRTMQKYSQDNDLKPRKTVYRSWGKGPKKVLRFSKSGDQNIEHAYATHIIMPNQPTFSTAS